MCAHQTTMHTALLLNCNILIIVFLTIGMWLTALVTCIVMITSCNTWCLSNMCSLVCNPFTQWQASVLHTYIH